MKMRGYISIIILLLVTISCGNKKKEAIEEKEGSETVLASMPNEVTVLTLKKQLFSYDLMSNGKVKAHESANLFFRTPEVIANVWVKNGDRVKKGDKIAQLDLFKLKNNLTQRQNSLEKATIMLKNALIGQGYALDEEEAIPKKSMKRLRIKSGYAQSKTLYELAVHELEQATLVAPFDGIVANLFDKKNNRANSAQPFCRIINSTRMEVEFTVLESELPLIEKGDTVIITPYASTTTLQKGYISEINPLVNPNGMVHVKAKVLGHCKLYDGMNVRVKVKLKVGKQNVIPKSAVVLRTGRQVVFTLEKGKAIWNYVTTGLENMNEYVVTGDAMREGAQIIVTGNVNLADGTSVKVIDKK